MADCRDSKDNGFRMIRILIALILIFGAVYSLSDGQQASDVATIREMLQDARIVLPFNWRQLIYPGTKYCGVGNSSTTRIDPKLKGLDDCCEEHDNCKISVPAGNISEGFFNPFFVTL